MAVPKHRVSRSKRGMRRAHQHLSIRSLSECPQCHNVKLPHRVCPHCGSYKGKEVITVNQE